MSNVLPLYGFGGSGRAPLDFRVSAYATVEALLADTPSKKTVGVVTEVKITSWAFAPLEPTDPSQGMLWFTTGTASDAEFNALKKNVIQIYPIFCKQYVDGEWVVVSSYLYATQWSSIWDGVLYNAGAMFVPYAEAAENGTITFGESNITIATKANLSSRVYVRFGPFPMENIKTLSASFKVLDSVTNGSHYGHLFVSQKEDAYYYDEEVTIKAIVSLSAGGSGAAELDLSEAELTGHYYVYVGSSANQWDNARKYAISKVYATI